MKKIVLSLLVLFILISCVSCGTSYGADKNAVEEEMKEFLLDNTSLPSVEIKIDPTDEEKGFYTVWADLKTDDITDLSTLSAEYDSAVKQYNSKSVVAITEYSVSVTPTNGSSYKWCSDDTTLYKREADSDEYEVVRGINLNDIPDYMQTLSSTESSSIDIEPPAASSQVETSVEATDLGLSQNEILESIDFEEPVDEIVTFNIPGYVVSVYKPGVRPLNIYVLSDEKSSVVKAVMIKGKESYFGANGNTSSFVSKVFRSIKQKDLEGIEEFERNAGEYQIFYLAPASLKEELYSFPAKLSELNADGMFLPTEEEIDQLKEYLENGDLQPIIDFLNSKNADDPISNRLKELCSEAISLMDNVTFEYDEVEGKSIITYKDLNALSDDVHCLTKIEDNSIFFSMGFYASDWIFFDKMILKPNNADGKTHSYKSYDVNREVVDGGVFEYVTIGLHDDEIESLAAADSVTIRFRNSDTDNYLDFELTEDELQAIKTLPHLQNLMNQISDMLFAQKNNPI